MRATLFCVACVAASGLAPHSNRHGSLFLGHTHHLRNAEQWCLHASSVSPLDSPLSSSGSSSSSSGSGSISSTASSSGSRRFYATTTSGCEAILLAEVRSLPEVKQAKAGKLCVTFSGSARTGFAALLQLRTALKVCEVLAESPAGERIKSPEALYSFVKDAVPWSDVLSSRHNTIRVESVLGAVDASLSHSHFSALTVKNAIVDAVRDKTKDRPTVDVVNPDLPFLVYLHNGACTLYRVWSGASSMHKRGYRGGDATATHKASLRETTAASLLLAAGYAPTTAPANARVLVDPMCGSGSIVVEAALLLLNVAPGLIRYAKDGGSVPSATHFVDVDQTQWEKALEEAKALDGRSNKLSATRKKIIYANDVDAGALALAEDAARRAGVDHLISFSLGDAARLRLPPQLQQDGGVLCVTNPPWALRLEEGSPESWTSLGEFARCNLAGPSDDLWVLAGNPGLLRYLDLDAPKGFLAMNAANVDMRFLHYQVIRPPSPPPPLPQLTRIADSDSVF